MRQFNYFYTSYIKNKHGFFTFVPHANFFHPYFGFADIGVYISKTNPIGKETPYQDLIKYFHENKLTFTQKVKIFFPEIRNGMVYVDKIKYSVDAGTIDEIKINYKVVKNSEYYDYVPIKNHIADFEIEIEVDQKYSGIHEPVEIKCDYIDLLLYKQRISITQTNSSIKMVPYLFAHRMDDNPVLFFNIDSRAILHMRNTLLKYSLYMPISSGEFLKRFGLNYVEGIARKDIFSPANEKVAIVSIDARMANLMLEYKNIKNAYMHKNKDKVPLINSTWFTDTFNICGLQVQSYWYTTVYSDKFVSIDVPNTICVKTQPQYSKEETRGDVWYTYATRYKLNEEKLDENARATLNLENPYVREKYNNYKHFFLKKGVNNG